MAKKGYIQRSMTKSMRKVVNQASNIEKKMQKQKKEISKKEFFQTSADEMLTIYMTGDRKVTKVDIDQALFETADAKTFGKTIMDTFNELTKQLNLVSHTVVEGTKADMENQMSQLLNSISDNEDTDTDTGEDEQKGNPISDAMDTERAEEG